MPNKIWSTNYSFKQALGINGAALIQLYEILVGAPCEEVRITLRLPDGEEQTFSKLSELNELVESEIQRATQIGISGNSAEANIYAHLSREQYSPSFYNIKGSDRNKIHVLNGLFEDFQKKYSTQDAIRSRAFISLGGFDSAPSETVDPNSAATDHAETHIGISKKLRKIPDELPDAKIYLDDLEEISNILIEVYKKYRSKYDPEPTIVYHIGDEEFSSLAALQDRGGASRKLSVSISGNISRSVRIRGILQPEVNLSGLDDSIKWMVYGRIRLIFDSRSYHFKNAVRSLPTWVKVLIYAGWLGCLHFVDPHQSHTAILITGTVYLLLPLLIGMELFRRSVVIFSPSHKASGLWTERKLTYIQNFLFTLLGAALSVLFQALYDHIKAK